MHRTKWASLLLVIGGIPGCNNKAASSGSRSGAAIASPPVAASGPSSSADGSEKVTVTGQIAIDAGVGESVADRRVDLRDPHGDVVASTYSDAAGHYAIEAGQVALSTGAGLVDGGYEVTSLIDSDKAGKVFGIKQTLALTKAKVVDGAFDAGVAPFAEVSAIKGSVRFVDAAGAEVPKIAKAGTDAYLPGVSFFAKTDTDGRFLLLYVPAGAYTLRLEKASFSKEQAVTVADGRTVNVGVVAILADTKAPVTIASVDSTDFKNPMCLTLTADKPAKIYFTVDGATPVQNATFLYDSTHGDACGATPVCALCIQARSTTLKFVAVDLAGNVEDQQSKFYFYNEKWADPADRTPPVTALTVTGAVPTDGAIFTGRTLVTLKSSKGGSTYYTTDAAAALAAFVPYTAPFYVGVTGAVRYYSIDYSANTEAIKSKSFKIYQWSKLATATAPALGHRVPSGDNRHGALTFDPVRNKVILVTVNDSGAGTIATYEWSGSDWSLKNSFSPPGFSATGIFYSMPLFYSATRQKSYMLVPVDGATYGLRLYEYDGIGTWTQLSNPAGAAAPTWITGTAPGYLGVTATYVPSDDAVVVLDAEAPGSTETTYLRRILFDPNSSANTWVASNAETGVMGNISSFVYGTAAYGGAAGAERLVFYGAASEGRGVTLQLPKAQFAAAAASPGTPVWTETLTDQTPPALCPDMVYLANIDRLLLFGGADSTVTSPSGTAAANPMAASNGTWVFDGASWAVQDQGTRPPARYCASMVYLPTTQSIMLFGGTDRFGTLLQDTWQFSF